MIVKRDLGLRMTISEFHYLEFGKHAFGITEVPGEPDAGLSVSFSARPSGPGCNPGQCGDNYLLPDWSGRRGDSGEGVLPRVLDWRLGSFAQLQHLPEADGRWDGLQSV